jgi:hypothetical protein
MDLGSEIRDPEKTYSGSRIQGSKRHRIPDPQHWSYYFWFMIEGSGSGGQKPYRSGYATLLPGISSLRKYFPVLGLHVRDGLAVPELRVRLLHGRNHLQIRHSQRRPEVSFFYSLSRHVALFYHSKSNFIFQTRERIFRCSDPQSFHQVQSFSQNNFIFQTRERIFRCADPQFFHQVQSFSLWTIPSQRQQG